MFNSYAFAFAGVAIAFTAGADYVVQSKANGSYPGAYPVSTYLESYGIRYTDTMAALDKAKRQSEAAREHLPEAPEGWERRTWDTTNPDEAEILSGMILLEQMEYKKAMKKAALIARKDAWEYVRGEEVIRLSARFTHPDDEENRMNAVGALLSGAQFGEQGPKYEPYGIVQGVPFFRVLETDINGGEALALEAFIGDGIQIGVAATAAPETVRAFLERIDYDNLNLMLDAPQPRIGSAAPTLTADEEMALAAFHAAMRYETERLASNALGNQFLDQLHQQTEGGELNAVAQESAAPAKPAVREVKLNGGQALGERDANSGVKRLQVGQSGDKPTRLQLSGGRSCLGNASGKFCD